MNEIFKTLSQVNVNDLTEERNGLTYLSWARGWAKLKELYPNSTYSVTKYGDEQKPYIYDDNLGYMCHTSVTVEDYTLEMWLPVMDSANNAMKSTPYTYQVWDRYEKKYKDKKVASATMFDVNKTIMRCLAKNIAMFGLGLYIYAGEDLPMQLEDANPEPPAKKADTNNPYYKDNVDLVIEIINVCKDVAKIQEVFRANPQFKTDKKLIDACKKKKEELEKA